jgi:hypothetical protein
MSSSELRKSRLKFLLLLSVFVIPIVIAKLALDNHWYNEAVTNQGELLEGELSLVDLNLTDEAIQKKWLIMYQLPEHCEKACQQSLYGINQTYVSLGRETGRVTPVGLYSTVLNEDSLGQIKKDVWHFSLISDAAKVKLDPTYIYIADSLGNIILRYPLPESEQDALDFGRSLLSDLRKLLKYSRIG